MNGYIYDGWKDMPKKQHNGVEYSVLDLDVAYFSLDNKPPSHAPGLNAELSEISIKRNSRFSAVPEHIHTHIEINYVYSGSCPQVIDGHPITLQKNQVLLIDTNCPHSIAPLGENDIVSICLISFLMIVYSPDFLSMRSTKRLTMTTTCFSTQKMTVEFQCSLMNCSVSALIHPLILRISSCIFSTRSWRN